MRTFRNIAIALSVLVMIGEIYRSWGDGRHIAWVLDDILGGLYMIFAAVMFSKDTRSRRALFASAWGVAVGMLYMSFFSSLLSGDDFNSGNLNWQFLTIVKGVFFAGAILCLYLSIRMPYEKDTAKIDPA